MNSKTIGTVVLVLILIGIALYYYKPSLTTPVIYPTSPAASQGTIVYAISDASTDLSSVSSIQITIGSVQAHSATQGWVTLSSAAHTFDLLQLKASGKTVLIASSGVSADNYDQVRLHVDSVTITNTNGTTSDAKVPSGDIRIVGTMNVAANTTSVAVFDFLANESFHVTGNGKYILAPVIHLRTMDNANTTVDSDNSVHANGGNANTDTKVGMDVDGNVGIGLGIAENQTLSIDNNGHVKIGLGV